MMGEYDVATAKARAEDICNGFMQVRIQQAHDVVRLANELMAANRKIGELQRKIDELRVPLPVSPGVPDFLSGLFGGGRK